MQPCLGGKGHSALSIILRDDENLRGVPELEI